MLFTMLNQEILHHPFGVPALTPICKPLLPKPVISSTENPMDSGFSQVAHRSTERIWFTTAATSVPAFY